MLIELILNKLIKSDSTYAKLSTFNIYKSFSYARGVLARQYTERLISEAVLHGDKHQPTMEIASWWLGMIYLYYMTTFYPSIENIFICQKP